MSNMTLYVTEDQRKRMRELAERLEKSGVGLRDGRGNISYSALFRYLIDDKASQLDEVQNDAL